MSSADDRDPLALDADTMRALGYRAVDMLVDRLSAEPGPVVSRIDPAEMLARVAIPAPEQPAGFDEILDGLEHDVLPHVARLGHPAYMAFIPGEPTWPGALGDLIASALNLDTCWWLGAAGPTALELAVLGWFRDWIGLPAETAGVLVSGGSAANMTALACARETLIGAMSDEAVIYLSDQTHSSLARAARVLGFRPEQVRVLPTDDAMRLRPDALRGAMESDRAAGLMPLAVVGNAGTTNSGAVDPLPELARICREQGVWLHVDAAYGGFACLTERGGAALAGLELADSITLDPHKWLYQPVELGALLIRDGDALRRAFEITPDYLKDVEAVAREVNFSDYGVQLTRTCRALKLWISLRYFGVPAFRATIDRCLDLVAEARTRIDAAEQLELVTEPSLGILTFRRRPPGVDDEDELERINAELIDRCEREGAGFVSSTRLRGRYAIRLCILNHSTGRREVERLLDFLEHAPVEVAPARAETPAAPRDRNPGIEAGWLRRPRLDRAGLRALPLFAALDDATADRVLHAARERHVRAGERVVEQWAPTRDVYVILSGAVRIEADGRTVADLGPGEFFGELAAVDWGASFGRPRLADATSHGTGAAADDRLAAAERPDGDGARAGPPGRAAGTGAARGALRAGARLSRRRRRRP